MDGKGIGRMEIVSTPWPKPYGWWDRLQESERLRKIARQYLAEPTYFDEELRRLRDGVAPTTRRAPCKECPCGRHVKSHVMDTHLFASFLAPVVNAQAFEAQLDFVLDALETKQMLSDPDWDYDHDRVLRQNGFGLSTTGRTSSKHPNQPSSRALSKSMWERWARLHEKLEEA